jgi:hypothetical protein
MGGMLTFMKPGKFAVSMNARPLQPFPGYLYLSEKIQGLFGEGQGAEGAKKEG